MAKSKRIEVQMDRRAKSSDRRDKDRRHQNAIVAVERRQTERRVKVPREGCVRFSPDSSLVVSGRPLRAEPIDEVSGTSIAQLISPETREIRDDYLEHFLRSEIQRLIGHEGELTGRHKDGSSFPMAVKISGMWLEDRQKYIAMVSNISERKALIENLRKLAEHDGLTGLYNRSYFHGELERVVERVHRSEVSNCALLYIDLDHFKYVNDTLGHAAGDKLLIEVANILTRRARKSDLVARLGGDEFTVLLYDTDPKLVENVADSFRRQLADYSFSFEGKSATIGCSSRRRASTTLSRSSPGATRMTPGTRPTST